MVTQVSVWWVSNSLEHDGQLEALKGKFQDLCVNAYGVSILFLLLKKSVNKVNYLNIFPLCP